MALTQEKLLHEEEERVKVEADIARLEGEEYELIQRLQKTELLQHSAERKLKKVISEPDFVPRAPSHAQK